MISDVAVASSPLTALRSLQQQWAPLDADPGARRQGLAMIHDQRSTTSQLGIIVVTWQRLATGKTDQAHLHYGRASAAQ